MINKNHENYPKYETEWNEILTAWKSETENLKPSGGLDGGDFDRISKKYIGQFKKLKQKYSYLFKEFSLPIKITD